MRPVLGVLAAVAFAALTAACQHARPEAAADAEIGRAPPSVAAAADAGASADGDVAAGAVTISATRGRVERGGGGSWRPADTGARLGPNDHLRTGADGEATLIVPGVGTVVLSPRSDFEIGRRTRELMSLSLGHGRLRADVDRGGGLPLRIAIRGSDAVAESRDGSFSVLTAGGGTVAVAAERGTVDVTARARTIRVDAGDVAVVAPGAAPSAPRPIPPSLILKIAHAPRELAAREVTISGRTAPGAIVTVTGLRPTAVTADADGRFAARVALAEGGNRVIVEAIDAVGRRAREQLPVIVDTRPPDIEAEVRWGP